MTNESNAAPPPPDAMAPAAPVAAVGEAVAWVIRGTAALSNEGEILSLACQSARPSGDPRWEPLYAAPQPRSSPLTEEKDAQPDPEKVMDLAFAMSRADVCCVLTAETKAYHENHRIRDAAREALRAYVTAKEVK